MREALGVAFVLVGIGCAGEPRAAQPIRLVQAESSEPVPEPVAAVEPEPLPTLAEATSSEGRVTLQPSHLMTATGETEPALLFGPGTESAYDLALREPGRVSLEGPSGSIPFTLEPGPEAYGDVNRTLVLVVAAPLESGWHTLAVELPGRVGGAITSGDRRVSRFRPDSHPVLQGVFAATRDGVRIIEARFSERVTPSAPTGWRIWDDEGALPCRGLAAERPEDRIVWTCSRAETGSLHIDFGGVLTTSAGDSLMSTEGEVLTQLALQSLAEPDAAGVVSWR